jgi:hypothetical protein
MQYLEREEASEIVLTDFSFPSPLLTLFGVISQESYAVSRIPLPPRPNTTQFCKPSLGADLNPAYLIPGLSHSSV